jgi:hypothetical protein
MPDTLAPDILKKAKKKRLYFKEVTDLQKEAFAAYYGRTLLHPYIEPYSKGEDRWKLLTRSHEVEKHYDNYPKEVAALYIEGVYRSNEVSRISKDKDLDEYFKKEYDVWFQSEFCPMFLIMPEIFIFLWDPELAVDPTTMAQQREMKAWPRPSLAYPDEIMNFERNPDGSLAWVSQMLPGNVLRIIDDTYIYEVDKQGAITSTEHKFDKIPVLRISWRDNAAFKKLIGEAYLSEVTLASFANLQWKSMLVEAGKMHLSLNLIMGDLTFQNTGGKIGNDRVIKEEGGSDQPSTRYLEMPDTQIRVLVDLVYNYIPKTVYRVARLRDRSTEQNLSGIAKIMDAVPEFSALAGVANVFQAVDHDLCSRIASKYKGIDTELVVKYPSTFDLKSVGEIMTNLVEMVDAQAASEDVPRSPALMKELFLSAARTMLPDASDLLLKQITLDVDAYLKKRADIVKQLDLAKSTTPAPAAPALNPAPPVVPVPTAKELGNPYIPSA